MKLLAWLLDAVLGARCPDCGERGARWAGTYRFGWLRCTCGKEFRA